MTHRLAPALALAFLLSAPAVALADLAPPDAGGTGGGTSGAGGSGSFDPSCNVAQQQQAGETCESCSATASDMTTCQAELGGGFNFACQSSADVQVWCNGPDRNSYQSGGCTIGGVQASPARVAGGVGAALLVLAAWAARRRR